MQGWYMTCDYSFSFYIAAMINNTESTTTYLLWMTYALPMVIICVISALSGLIAM